MNTRHARSDASFSIPHIACSSCTSCRRPSSRWPAARFPACSSRPYPASRSPSWCLCSIALSAAIRADPRAALPADSQPHRRLFGLLQIYRRRVPVTDQADGRRLQHHAAAYPHGDRSGTHAPHAPAARAKATAPAAGNLRRHSVSIGPPVSSEHVATSANSHAARGRFRAGPPLLFHRLAHR
jgi:hypothetical protein